MDEHRDKNTGADAAGEQVALEYRKPQVKKMDVYETTALGGCDPTETSAEEPDNCAFAS